MLRRDIPWYLSRRNTGSMSSHSVAAPLGIRGRPAMEGVQCGDAAAEEGA